MTSKISLIKNEDNLHDTKLNITIIRFINFY